MSTAPQAVPPPPVKPQPIKPGVRTSEFWLTVALNLAALSAAIDKALPARYAAIAGAVSVALYSIARGWAKS